MKLKFVIGPNGFIFYENNYHDNFTNSNHVFVYFSEIFEKLVRIPLSAINDGENYKRFCRRMKLKTIR